jgi:two-component system, LytTR family, sensor histidine kinase AlgZ
VAGAPAPGDVAARKMRRLTDGAKLPVLPDLCNPGIALRVLVPAQVTGALCVLALPGAGDPARWYEFALVLEPSLLGSMLLLCLLRRSANGLPTSGQWAVALLLPTLATCGVAAFAAGLVVPGAGTPELAMWIGVRGAIAFGCAWFAIQFLRLRTLSLSPSLAEARLQALQARIRPHFLFNSLNTVLGLMRSDPRRAENTLENLSDLFRVFMRDTRDMVPMAEEIDTCQQYLAIEQLRLGDRLQVRVECEEAANDALVPSLLLQPLVENAVHHGIEPRIEPGEVLVRVAKAGERVRVEIFNPVSEQQPSRPGNQMALSNVRERLMLLYDIAAELKTVEEDGQFRLSMEYPYRKERRRRDVRRHFNPYR